MAKQGTRVLPARKSAAARDDDSLLTRSAESLGRVIGSLQRQMRGAGKRMSNVAEEAMNALPDLPKLHRGVEPTPGVGEAARKRTRTRKASAAPTPPAARKSAGARSSARSKRTAARAKKTGKAARAAKTSRRR